MLVREIPVLSGVGLDVVKCQGFRFPLFGGSVEPEHVATVDPCRILKLAGGRVSLAGVAARDEPQGFGTTLHPSLEQGQQADPIDDRLVFHGDANDIQHGGIHVHVAHGDVRAHGLGDLPGPFEQSDGAAADAPFFLDAGSIGDPTVVADEPKQGIVSDAEPPQLFAQFADSSVQPRDLPPKVLLIFREVRVEALELPGSLMGSVRRTEADLREKGPATFRAPPDEIERDLHDGDRGFAGGLDGSLVPFVAVAHKEGGVDVEVASAPDSLIKSNLQGMGFSGAHTPFSEMPGFISGFLQRGRHGDLPLLHWAYGRDHSGAQRCASGQDGHAPRRTRTS